MFDDFGNRCVALTQELDSKGLSADEIKQAVSTLPIELPSWMFGGGGTRFKTFEHPAAARTVHEKIADAALVNKLTGACPSVALHIPWDMTDDWQALADYAKSQGLRIGGINPNLFQDDDYRLGSICHADAKARAKAVAHIKDCIEIAKAVGSNVVSLWLADGTNYPGQDDIRERRHRLLAALKETYAALPAGMTYLIEYKLFEPAFYHTDLADWGASYTVCSELGPQAKVLVDTGHHAPGTNIEYIVSWLLDLDRLGGFHFNCRKYADDDLIVASSNPFELFLIFHELINGGQNGRAAAVEYMLDQSQNIENKIEAAILSVMNVQSAYAKALCINREHLSKLQKAGDVMGAHRMLHEAFETDVRPLLAEMREDNGCPADPFLAYKESGVTDKLTRERV
jgi:L-rhamnose isomerase / sugar isomerase